MVRSTDRTAGKKAAEARCIEFGNGDGNSVKVFKPGR
jgi:hypothetical protein